MLVKVKVMSLTPQLMATSVVKGGLLYSRLSRSDRIQELTRGGDYSRVVREWIPRRSNRDWKTPRSQRVSYTSGRTVRFSRPPAQQQNGAHLIKVRPLPEGWGLPLDGEPGAVAYWEKRFHRVAPPSGPDSSSYLEVHHRGGIKFVAWAARRRRHSSLWGYRPRKEQDPLRGVYDYLSRGGFSFLGGLRSEHSQGLDFRLSRLYRRQRQHNLLDVHLEEIADYRALHWGKRRRKLPPGEAQHFLFRRRRLRGYLTGRVSHRNYINRLTRRGFYRWHPNRWARLERVSLLGGTYFEPRSSWGTYLLGSRVGTPLEYHLYNPFIGFGRLIKRRREGSRRWKLGQHSLWGIPHLKSRQAKWSWFKETPLGALNTASLAGGEPSPAREPQSGSLEGSLYWSARKWGRSRWERPTPRGTKGFIYSLKGGTIIEIDSQQWGKAGTSGVGIFMSLAAEQELRSPYSFFVKEFFSSDLPSLKLLNTSFRSRWVNPFFFTLSLLVKKSIWAVIYVLWTLFTPFWWIYSSIAYSICWICWRIRQAGWLFYASFGFVPTLLSHFIWQGLTLPVGDYLTHWVKDTSLAKAVGWVWTSWMLVYSSDEDQRKLDVATVEESEDGAQEYYLDDVDPTGENRPDPGDDEVDIHGGAPRLPNRESWVHGFDFGVNAGIDSFWEFVLEEIPYWIGFLLQPLIDFSLRLPTWALLEGISLLTLTLKLETQRVWSLVLNCRGGPRKGRWWKIPLVLIKTALHFLLWLLLIWVVGTTLSYSTLRLEVVLWGWPWREEYYLFWWLLVILLVTKLVGPAGIKNFFFTDVGWSNWLGFFWGATEAAPPEEYYPGRPLSLLTRTATTTVGMTMRRHKTYDDTHTIYREDGAYLGGPHNTGYDEIQIILAHKYETGDNPNWEEPDEANWFNFPLHLAHTLDQETSSPYGIFWSPLPVNEFRNRAWREPHLTGNNYYELTYAGHLGRHQAIIYFLPELSNGLPYRHHLAPGTDLRLHSHDESLTENPSDFNET